MTNKIDHKYYKKASGNKFDSGDRENIINFISNTHTADNSLLEVGCGTGEILNSLPSDIRYTGVDVSQHAINLAKEKNHKYANFVVLKEDIDILPFNEESFDFVVSVFSLEHFKYPQKYLKEMVRVLKKGGYIIILAPNLELPISKLNAVRHKSIFYNTILTFKRLIDYVLRIFNIWRFRPINPNYTEVTGKYEKPDDDLRYIVSSYEVISFLREHRCKIISAKRFKSSPTVKSFLQKIITYLPTMEYYGTELFVIMEKTSLKK